MQSSTCMRLLFFTIIRLYPWNPTISISIFLADRVDQITDVTRKESSTISLLGGKISSTVYHDQDDKKCVTPRDYTRKINANKRVQAWRLRPSYELRHEFQSSCDSYTIFTYLFVCNITSLQFYTQNLQRYCCRRVLRWHE